MTLLQKDNNIETNNTLRLSVQISLTGLSFLVSTIDSDEASYFYKASSFPPSSTPQEIEHFLKKELTETSEFSKKFSEVILIYATDLSTLVPKALFDETKASEYLKFNSKILPNDYIAFDALTSLDINNVYVPYVNINNLMFDVYGSFSYYHNITVLLKLITQEEKNASTPSCYINVFKNHFNLFIIKNGKPLLVNSYQFNTAEDFIYYILFAFEQLSINPDTIKTIVLGNISKEDKNFEILYKYVRNVDFYSAKALQKINLGTTDAEHKNVALKYFSK